MLGYCDVMVIILKRGFKRILLHSEGKWSFFVSLRLSNRFFNGIEKLSTKKLINFITHQQDM